MMEGFLSWFGSRTTREQILLKAAAVVLVGGGLLLFVFQTASSYRTTARADLDSALQMRDDLVRLKALENATPAPLIPASDGSVRGIVAAAASQFALSLAHIEPDGPTGIRTTFEPANAQDVYQWLDAVERAGLIVNRIALVRAGEDDIVEAGATIVSR